MAIDKKISTSFYSLNQTNPRLSGNIKFLVDDNDIYIDSIDSNSELSRTMYKSYKINTNNNLMANLKNYVNLFEIKDNLFDVAKDINNVVNDLSNQHHRLYNCGASSDLSELISKRFRYFAPVYVNNEANKPDLFVIYSVDRSKLNTSNEYVKELLYVHDFRYSEMGKQLDRHIDYLKNTNYDMGIFVNFGDNISYSGTSLTSGLLESRYENDFDSLLANERTITEFNKHIIDGFKRHNLIDSRFLNLEFAFDIDLQKDSLNDKFIDVIGTYITLEELSSLNEYNISNFDLKVLEDNKTVREHKGVLSISDLKDNYINVSNILGVQYTSNNYPSTFTPLIMIEPKFIPTIGDKIVLSYNGNTEITYIIQSSDIVSNDIMETATKIAKSFSEFARLNVSNLFVDAFIHSGRYLVIRSLIDDDSYNNIKVDIIPPQYQIKTPLYTDELVYDNTFYSPNDKSVLTVSPIGIALNNADSLRLGGVVSRIKYVSRWLDYYFYNLEEPLKTLNSESEMFEVIKTEKSKMYNCKLIEHRTFDFDTEITYHEDVFDFELVTYKNWLLSEINKPTFLGKYEGSTPSQVVLDAYKVSLISIIDRYFDAIDLHRNMLLKDVNTDTFEATSIKNEFDRLNENDNIELIKYNQMNPSINKFMYQNGLDVYNRPYTLNLSLPFRYDNFAPSLTNNNRDLRHSTHSWLVIGEGLPPYFNDISINGENAIIKRDIDSEQVVEVIDRMYNNIGIVSELNKWVTTNSNIVSNGADVSKGIITFTSSNNSIKRPLVNLGLQSLEPFKFNYKFKIRNSSNTNVNIKIDIVDNSTNISYKSYLINHNVVGGIDYSINETHIVQLPTLPIDSDLVIRISCLVGWTSTLLIEDINLYKSTITMQTVSDLINFDSDDVNGYHRYISDMVTSYTTIPITIEDILNKDKDVFNYIRSHSIIRDENDNGTCFFRGVKVLVDKKYKDWKFASILLTKKAPIGKERSIELYENNTFKSLVLVVNMYVPEPVLTSIEQPNKYWLDRSVLYFSDGNYASENGLSSFGKENLSVKIHELNTPKKFLGNVITNDWYFQQNGINYIHVAKGILSRFNVDFTSLLDLGGDFNAFFSNVDDSETVNYGMQITFKEIQEITSDYFWCKEIHVKIKETVLGVTTTIEYDILSEYLSNNNTFILKNRMDIVEAILLENAQYDRVLRNTSIIERFSLLSTASIFEWLNSNKVTVNKDDGTNYLGNIVALQPNVNVGVIRLKSDNKNITQLPTMFTNTFARQSGVYEPITKMLRSGGKRFETKIIDYGYSNKASYLDLVPIQQSNDDKVNNSIWYYRNDFSNIDLEKHYRYYHTREDFETLHWFTNPMEYKHNVSTILSSKSEMKLKYIYDGDTINLQPLVKDYLIRLLDNSGYNNTLFSDSEKVTMLKLFNNNVTLDTLNQYDFDSVILDRFYKSCFSVIYDITKLQNLTTDKLVDFYELSDDVIKITDTLIIGDELEITINRM